MMRAVWYLGTVVVCYLLGCINTAAILSRLKGFDIREKGSNNAGASNAMLTMGKGAGVLTAVVDIAKAFLPVFALIHWIPQTKSLPCIAVLGGVMVVFGHMFPFWMQFRGGKGFASLLGMTLAHDWRLLIIMLALLCMFLLTTKFISLATISCATILPFYRLFSTYSVIEFILLFALSVVIIRKHQPNIERIRKGKEYDADDVLNK